MSVQYGGDKITFADGSTVGSGWSGFKNRLINSDMRIDQRNNGSLLTPATNADVFPVDRWIVGAYGGGTLSSQRSTTAPDDFNNSIVVTVTGTDTSLASSDLYEITQRIEGNTVADLKFGTSSAKPISLSFWVRSSVTGSYSVGIENGDGTRSYVVTYTINSANTWEYKTFSIQGDTTGNWYTNNTIGLQLRWCLATGTGRVASSANAWETGNFIAISSTANPIMGTSGATFYITGVQLEKGSTATSFDYRPYGTELQLCQRYFQQIQNMVGLCMSGGQSVYASIAFPVEMRASPSASQSGVFSFEIPFGTASTQSSTSVSIATSGSSGKGVYIYMANFSGLTGGQTYMKQSNTNTLLCSAEL